MFKLTSIASIQTKGLKRHFFEEAHPEKIKRKKDTIQVKLNSISGSKRKKLLQTNNKPNSGDPNIVGFDSSDTDVSESADEATINDNQNDNEVDFQIETEACIDVDGNNEEITIIEQIVDVPPIELKDDSEHVKKKQSSRQQRKPAIYVHVMRNDNIQKARLKLPILAEEQHIMEIINENSVVILAG